MKYNEIGHKIKTKRGNVVSGRLITKSMSRTELGLLKVAADQAAKPKWSTVYDFIEYEGQRMKSGERYYQNSQETNARRLSYALIQYRPMRFKIAVTKTVQHFGLSKTGKEALARKRKRKP